MALTEDQSENAERARQGDAGRSRRHRTFAQKWRLVSLPNKLMVLATIVIAISNGIYTFVALRTLGEIRAGSKDTHDLAVAAGQQAKAVSDQAGILRRQASDTHDLAVAASTQASQAIAQAKSAELSAEAAKSASNTAQDALHISERAYVVIGAPTLDIGNKAVFLPLQNIGRIPSEVELVAHEATVDVPNRFIRSNLAAASGIHWKRHKFQSIIPGVPMGLKIPTIKMNADRLKSGLQLIIIAGFVSYTDGFNDTPKKSWPFCVQTSFHTIFNEVYMTNCDPSEYLPKLETVDGYPNNEQQNTQAPN